MYDSELKKYAEDILNSANFQRTKEHIQHGNMTVMNIVSMLPRQVL